MLNLLITICARGGSKGVKGKNIRKLAGHPLIYYTIKQALSWGKASHVVVSTDSLEIAKVAQQCGSEVPFIRPAHLATDTSPKVPVIRHALLECEKIYNTHFDAVMDLDTTSPIRKTSDLDECLELFTAKKPKTLFSVVPAHRNPYFNMVELTKSGKAKLSKPSSFHRRQDAPVVYDMNASIYIYNSNYLRNPKADCAITNNSIIYVMDELSRTDIDSELDFKMIEFLVQKRKVKL